MRNAAVTRDGSATVGHAGPASALPTQPHISCDSFGPAAHLQAVRSWYSRQSLTQLRTGSHWLEITTATWTPGAPIPRDQRLCRRCTTGSMDDVKHMLWGCPALEEQRLAHSSLFASPCDTIREFFEQQPTVLASFARSCRLNSCSHGLSCLGLSGVFKSCFVSISHINRDISDRHLPPCLVGELHVKLIFCADVGEDIGSFVGFICCIWLYSRGQFGMSSPDLSHTHFCS